MKVAVNSYELTFLRNSHRGGIILCYLVYKNESFFDYVLNDLTTLHELLHDADMKLSVELKNLQESLSFKDSLIIIIAAMILIWLMQTDEWVASNRILVFSQRFLGAPRGKHYISLEINVWRKAVSRSKEAITKRDHRFFAAALSELEWVMLIQGKRKFCLNNHEIWSKMNRLTFHHAHGLLWNWHRVLVSKFRHISLFSFVYVC